MSISLSREIFPTTSTREVNQSTGEIPQKLLAALVQIFQYESRFLRQFRPQIVIKLSQNMVVICRHNFNLTEVTEKLIQINL